jgi:hypothetical protein
MYINGREEVDVVDVGVTDEQGSQRVTDEQGSQRVTDEQGSQRVTGSQMNKGHIHVIPSFFARKPIDY